LFKSDIRDNRQLFGEGVKTVSKEGIYFETFQKGQANAKEVI